MTRLAAIISVTSTICFLCGCQPNPPQISREKQECPNRRCQKKVEASLKTYDPMAMSIVRPKATMPTE